MWRRSGRQFATSSFVSSTGNRQASSSLCNEYRLYSTERRVISTTKAPAAIGAYSQAIAANNTLYVSGQLGLHPETKDFTSPEVDGQTEQVMKNLGAILEAGGSSFDNVLKCTILLTDMSHFAKVDSIYSKYFPRNPPARATFATKGLPRGGLVEIECVALIPSKS